MQPRLANKQLYKMVNQNKNKMALSKVDNKIDADIDQEKYLREATHHFCGIDKPLRYGPVVKTLNNLIKALHKEFESNYVNIEMVNHLMLTYNSNPKEWRKYAKFDRNTYTRNLVDGGNGKFNLLALCWGEGHGSSIHDHSESHCFMKMLKGELREIRYEHPDQSIEHMFDADSREHDELHVRELRQIGKSRMTLNEVAYINDNLGLHRVENPSHTETAVSLHLYCPPFDTCSIFNKNCGIRTTAKVTFWSKHGIKTEVKVHK